MALGLASFGIAGIAKKHSRDTDAYRTKATRFDREKRLKDFLDGKK